MPPRQLSDGEHMWRRIKASVKPLRPQPAQPILQAAPTPATAAPTSRARKIAQSAAPPSATAPPPTQRTAADALNKAWERDVRAGRLAIDLTIDLHGSNLAGAHSRLTRAIDSAILSGARVILIIAGKARGADEAPRGAIRRELAHWLDHGGYARHILALRGAHPRHGGAGALYLILKRRREG